MKRQHKPGQARLIASVAVCAAVATAAACSPPSRGDAGGSTVTVAETTAPTTLDPQGSAMFADRFAWQLSYQCLLRTTPTGDVEPALAKSYEHSADGRTYTFELRDDVTFHNGEKLTADDVVYTFQRLKKSPDGIQEELYPTLDKASKAGEHTVKFHLSKPDAGFVNNMANPLVWGCAILSEKAADSGKPATTMVGTGPWQQVSYRPNSELKLKRFADYWGTKTASEHLNVLYVPEGGTQVSNLTSGKVDVIFPDQAGAKSLEESDKVKVDEVPSDSTIFLQVNNLAKPFDKLKVRQALALALDREELAQRAYRGAARASTYIPSGESWAPKPAAVPYSTQDIAKAKKLLREAGYPNGFSTTLMYISGYDAGTNDLVAAMQDQLKQVGIKVKLNPTERGAWGDKLVSAKYDLSWNAQSYYSNPYQYIQPAEGRQGPVPASLQKLLDEALKTKDQDAYRKALVKVQEHEATIVYPTLTLLATDSFVAYDKTLTRVELPASQSRAFLARVARG